MPSIVNSYCRNREIINQSSDLSDNYYENKRAKQNYHFSVLCETALFKLL